MTSRVHVKHLRPVRHEHNKSDAPRPIQSPFWQCAACANDSPETGKPRLRCQRCGSFAWEYIPSADETFANVNKLFGLTIPEVPHGTPRVTP